MIARQDLTSHEDALIAVGRLCEALSEQDVAPQMRWDFTVVIPAGRICLSIELNGPASARERDLMLQAATRLASLTR